MREANAKVDRLVKQWIANPTESNLQVLKYAADVRDRLYFQMKREKAIR